MSAAQTKFDQTLSRMDSVLDQRLRREEAELAAENAEREEARRVRAREHAEQRRQIAGVYDDAFRSFGTTVPEPADDEAPSRYRARLFNRLVRRLPEGHEWATTRADDIPLGPAMDNIEQLVLEAARQEGVRPSTENLPPSGELVSRTRTDDTNGKSIEWFGRESFIKSMGREGRKVAAIYDRKSGQAIWQARR